MKVCVGAELLAADRARDLSTTLATHSVSNPVLEERIPNFLSLVSMELAAT
jgi:hypothetical protein